MKDIVTADFSEFGYREIEMAIKLLTAYMNNNWDGNDDLGADITVNFNKYSGFVFLSDSEYQTALLNDDDKLEMWLNCGNCGHEDFASKFKRTVEEDSSEETEVDEIKCPECGHTP